MSKMDAREVDCAMAAWESTRRARCVGSARDAYLSHAGRQKAHFRRAKLHCALSPQKKRCELRHVISEDYRLTEPRA